MESSEEVHRSAVPGPDLEGRGGIDVLQLAATGHRTKEIAAHLSLSTRTVESHFTSVFNKLGVDSRLEAVMQATSRGLLMLDEDR